MNIQHHKLGLALLACCAALLLGVLPVAAQQPAPQPDLPPITVAAGQLWAGDQPFEVRGVNYIRPTGSDPACPELHFGMDGRCTWDQAAIDADLDRLRERGVNTVRIFLNYYIFGGARATDPSYSMATPLRHLDAFIVSANQRGIYVLPVLMAKYPQDQFGPEGLARTMELHIRPLAAHLAGRPGILGWDLFNEPDIAGPVDVHCWDWDNADFPLCRELARERIAFLNAVYYELKAIDPAHPSTIGMAFAKSYFRPIGELQLAYVVDFYSFHYYDNDPYDSGRYADHWYYGAGFPADLRRGIDELLALGLAKPVVITEIGFPSGEGAVRDEPAMRRDLALGLQTSREAGASGVMLWPFQPDPADLVGDLFQ